MNPDLQILFLFSNLAAEEPADHEQSHSSHPAAGNTDNNPGPRQFQRHNKGGNYSHQRRNKK
jgi:hypothetical protein